MWNLSGLLAIARRTKDRLFKFRQSGACVKHARSAQLHGKIQMSQIKRTLAQHSQLEHVKRSGEHVAPRDKLGKVCVDERHRGVADSADRGAYGAREESDKQ